MTTPADRTWINVTTLGDMISQRAQAHPEREALVYPTERYTYRQVDDMASMYAKGLLALGVEPGDRVGYFLHECAESTAIILGAAKIGAISVPLNARFKSFELTQVIEHSGMKVIFASKPDGGADLVGLIAETLPDISSQTPGRLEVRTVPELTATVILGDGSAAGFVSEADFGALASSIADATLAHRQAMVRVRETAVIMYTSGTTSSPKGAMLSHESFCRYADGSLLDRMGVTADSRVWTALPMFHIGGVGFALGVLYAGATYVHVGFFNPTVALAQLRDERCDIALAGFETIWLPIMNHPDRADGDLESIEILLCVGVEERLRQIQDSVPDAKLVGCFGQTEACAFLSLTELDDPLELRLTTGGFPLPGMECEIHDPDSHELLEPGNIGEVWYRGPNMFDGYFRDPELTESVFDDRGFFRTGDIVHMDLEGRITFNGRVKDMLKVGGENVSAAEVEGYLITHPDINIAQVVSAPDDKYVEVPAAYIELEPGATVTEQEIIDFCRGKIATFRVPRYVRFVDEWPMSGTKVKKFVLREQIAKELTEAGITEAPQITSS